jgi:hypothetical protein
VTAVLFIQEQQPGFFGTTADAVLIDQAAVVVAEPQPLPLPLYDDAHVADVLGRLRVAGPHGCWLWTGAIVKDPRGGYGKLKVAGRVVRAHRHVYALLVGPPPPLLDHLCRQRACCNPGHLQSSTVRENTALGLSGQRRRRAA